MMNYAIPKDIFQAAILNSTSRVKYFAEYREFPRTLTNKRNQTVAHIAAQNGNLDMLKYLLDVDDSVLGVTDIFGNSVFLVAVENGALDIIRYLVEERGVDLHQRNERHSSCTALHIAAEQGYVHVLQYFIEEKGVDANARNEVGEPPVFLAAERKQMSTLQYLVEDAKADVTTLDNKKDNILFISAKKGDLMVPKYLLEERNITLDVNWRNEAGYTIVFLAARFDALAFLQYFVEKRQADVNIADNNGRTALHEAAIRQKFPIVKYLVTKAGARSELKDNGGKTAAQLTTDPDLEYYLEQKPWRRDRRNVLSSFFPLPHCTTIHRSVPAIGQVQTSRVDASFLELAVATLSYFKSYLLRDEFEYKTLLSAQQIVGNAMDPVGIEAVNAAIDFGGV